MSISLTKRNFLYQITLLTLIAGWVGAGILHYLLPGHYFGGYPFIPVYFFLFGLFEISMFDACRKHAPQKMLLLYMAMKVMKMVTGSKMGRLMSHMPKMPGGMPGMPGMPKMK